MSRKPLSRAIATAFSLCLLGSPFIALGQDQDDDQETEAGALEEVIITGSPEQAP